MTMKKNEIERLIDEAINGAAREPIGFNELERHFSHLEVELTEALVRGAVKESAGIRWQEVTEGWTVGYHAVVKLLQTAAGLGQAVGLATRSSGSGASRAAKGPLFSQTNGRETALVRFVRGMETHAELHLSLLDDRREARTFAVTVLGENRATVDGPRESGRDGLTLKLRPGAYILRFVAYPDAGCVEMELHLTSTTATASAAKSSGT